VLAATVFHFGTLRIAEVKAALAAAGHPVRWSVRRFRNISPFR
jgi:imidazole glycerol phosphate synthase subunit HisF